MSQSNTQRRKRQRTAVTVPLAVRAAFTAPGQYTKKDREAIPKEDFGDPDSRKFPIVTPADVTDAAGLYGHASDPEETKSRIIAIAKRKGTAFYNALPEKWKEELERSLVPEVVRSADADGVTRLPFATITRIDEERREVTVTATSERRDSFKTRFGYDASKDAFTRWMDIGNIREMHQQKAVGNAVAVAFDDTSRKVDVTLRVSKGAEDTWQKVLDGTLKGASIGASNVVWEKPLTTRDTEESIPVATRYDLVELSLVDNPSNPDCRVLAIRAAAPDPTILDMESAMETITSPLAEAPVTSGAPQIERSTGVPKPTQTLDAAVVIAQQAMARGREELARMQQVEASRAIPQSVSGSNVFDETKPTSPLIENPTGKPTLNPTNATQKDAGVPEPSEGRPTPEEQVLNPNDFHEGGHKQEADWTEGDYDIDGDHHTDENGDKPIIASRPPEASKIPPDARPTVGDRAQKPEVKRVGARVSETGRDMLHGILGNNLKAAHDVADHCGCDECMNIARQLMYLINGQSPEGEEAEESAEEMEGLRVQLTEVARSVAELSQQIVKTTKSLSTRLSTLESGSAETQRTMQTETTRATEAAVATVKAEISPVLESLQVLRDTVTRIEQQPIQSSGPLGPGVHDTTKRLALGATNREDAIERIARSGDTRRQLDAFSILFNEQQS